MELPVVALPRRPQPGGEVREPSPSPRAPASSGQPRQQPRSRALVGIGVGIVSGSCVGGGGEGGNHLCARGGGGQGVAATAVSWNLVIVAEVVVVIVVVDVDRASLTVSLVFFPCCSCVCKKNVEQTNRQKRQNGGVSSDKKRYSSTFTLTPDVISSSSPLASTTLP